MLCLECGSFAKKGKLLMALGHKDRRFCHIVQVSSLVVWLPCGLPTHTLTRVSPLHHTVLLPTVMSSYASLALCHAETRILLLQICESHYYNLQVTQQLLKHCRYDHRMVVSFWSTYKPLTQWWQTMSNVQSFQSHPREADITTFLSRPYTPHHRSWVWQPRFLWQLGLCAQVPAWMEGTWGSVRLGPRLASRDDTGRWTRRIAPHQRPGSLCCSMPRFHAPSLSLEQTGNMADIDILHILHSPAPNA